MAFNNGVALMDWTRAMHKRLTEWFWVALSWRTESGRRVGINLSHGVYPHPLQPSTEGQAGLENGIWIDDRLIVVDAPLTVQGRPGGEVQVGRSWKCSVKTDTYSLELSFEPKQIVHSTDNLGLLTADLRHSLGFYTGQLTIDSETFAIDRLPGILEDHYARW